MSDPSTNNSVKITKCTNDPNATGRHEFMSAEATQRSSGKLRVIYISADHSAGPNTKVISHGQHNVTLPDPNGSYTTQYNHVLSFVIGDMIIIDQLDGVGSVESFDGQYAELLDTVAAGQSVRVIFELLPTQLGDDIHWKRHIG